MKEIQKLVSGVAGTLTAMTPLKVARLPGQALTDSRHKPSRCLSAHRHGKTVFSEFLLFDIFLSQFRFILKVVFSK